MARTVEWFRDRDALHARQDELERIGYVRTLDPDVQPGEYRILVAVSAGDAPPSFAVEIEDEEPDA